MAPHRMLQWLLSFLVVLVLIGLAYGAHPIVALVGIVVCASVLLFRQFRS